MTHNELLLKRIQTEYGLFRPIYTYEAENPIYDKDGNVIDYELIVYVEIMTAEEHYQKWLQDKENPPTPQPTLEDKISILEDENKMLKAQVEELRQEMINAMSQISLIQTN